MDQWDHYVDGQSRTSASGRYLDGFNPWSGVPAVEVAAGNEADVEAAVSAAAAAEGWRNRRPIERGRILLAIAHKIREKAGDLAKMESLETGRPAWQSPFEVEVAAQYFEFYGGLANLYHGETIGLGAGYHSYTTHEPYGIVGVITPWNAPINQAARGIAPALGAGNTVVAKPSEFTSGTTVELARLACEECGLPPVGRSLTVSQ